MPVTRSKSSNDPLFTSEEQDMYIKVNEELKFLEQKLIGTSKTKIYDPIVLKTHIHKLFEHIKLKNQDIDDHKGIQNDLTEKIKEQSEELIHLRRSLSERNNRIKELIAENDEIMENDYDMMVNKNSEIAALKLQLNQSSSLLSEMKNSEDSIKPNDLTLSQDFFATPKAPNTKTTTPHKKESVAKNLFYTPLVIPPSKKSGANLSPPKEFEKQTNERLSNIENNIDKILNKIGTLNTKNTPPVVSTKINKPIQPINTVSEQVDIFITGDYHAKNLKDMIYKQLHQKLVVKESIIDEGSFEMIAKAPEIKCKHLIITAGKFDIQKTPMKDIKKSIDTIFQKYQESTVHFIQIPYCFKDININYHIEQVNNILFQYLMRYKNVVIYKPKELIENWDYADQDNINNNGKFKICKAISSTILGCKPTQPRTHQPYERKQQHKQYENSYYYRSAKNPNHFQQYQGNTFNHKRLPQRRQHTFTRNNWRNQHNPRANPVSFGHPNYNAEYPEFKSAWQRYEDKDYEYTRHRNQHF